MKIEDVRIRQRVYNRKRDLFGTVININISGYVHVKYDPPFDPNLDPQLDPIEQLEDNLPWESPNYIYSLPGGSN